MLGALCAAAAGSACCGQVQDCGCTLVGGSLKRRQVLLSFCQPYLGRECLQRVLCERVDRFLPELFLFVELPQVAADNNAAERALRAQVVAGKISGGTRSPRGSESKSTLATIFSTWMAQGLNPFTNCLQLLSHSP